jgi:hypothetical protein
MKTPPDDNGSTKEPETDRRIVAETLAELSARQSCWRAEREAYARWEGARRFEAWIAAVQARFVTEAAEHYAVEHPPWTFERVADLRLQKTARQAGARAEITHQSGLVTGPPLEVPSADLSAGAQIGSFDSGGGRRESTGGPVSASEREPAGLRASRGGDARGSRGA